MIPTTREMDTRDALRAIREEHARERREYLKGVAIEVGSVVGALALIYAWMWATV